LNISERLEVLNNGVPLTAHEVAEPDGGRQHLIRADPGTLTVTYEATITRLVAAVAEPVTDHERLIALRPSRYCPADRLAGFAGGLFGQSATDLDRVREICAYVWHHVVYDTTSGPTTNAVDTLLSGRGVCRDFAHLVATLCRAVGVPARIAAVYAPGLSPMDFHAVVETGHRRQLRPGRHTAPRPTRYPPRTGRGAPRVV
jgi:transglutaminase-like putative cysteine protease